ncbi:hypothetical protein A5695_09610 [Mycobacterium sp. E1747]|nr:hypothetical protein A5695_09610 [Mycobacterium sp. E1747]
MPVVDYEPPPQDVGRNVPACRPSARAPLRRRSPHRYPPGRQPAEPAHAATSPQMRQAAAFADAALRRVLEVIDRRRPAAQLRPLLAPGLVDSVVAVGHSAAGHAGAAVLRRVRLQPAGPRDPDAAAEVSGSYSRGNRMHAIACRVERVPADAGARWLVVALHIG